MPLHVTRGPNPTSRRYSDLSLTEVASEILLSPSPLSRWGRCGKATADRTMTCLSALVAANTTRTAHDC
jgi:hypothetical protein